MAESELRAGAGQAVGGVGRGSPAPGHHRPEDSWGCSSGNNSLVFVFRVRGAVLRAGSASGRPLVRVSYSGVRPACASTQTYSLLFSPQHGDQTRHSLLSHFAPFPPPPRSSPPPARPLLLSPRPPPAARPHARPPITLTATSDSGIGTRGSAVCDRTTDNQPATRGAWCVQDKRSLSSAPLPTNVYITFRWPGCRSLTIRFTKRQTTSDRMSGKFFKHLSDSESESSESEDEVPAARPAVPTAG